MSTALLVGGLLLALGWGAVQSILAAELSAWIPHVTRRLIHVATARLPPGFRQRYKEEWLAESEQLADRKLTALVHAARLCLRAGRVRAELPAGSRRWRGRFSTRSMRLRAISDIHLEPSVQGSIRTGPLVEWGDVVRAMNDPALSQVDQDLVRVEAAFATLLEPSPLSSSYVRALEELRTRPLGSGVTRRPESDDGTKTRRGITTSANVTAREPHVGALRKRPPAAEARRRRFGPAGRVDPCWSIAPLTRSERRRAESYRQALTSADPICEHWPPSARRALLVAIDEYDDPAARRAARRRAPADDSVRLSVFLDGWDTGVKPARRN